MTLKDYNDALASSENYDSWFSSSAHHTVLIAGVSFPCVRITKQKVALSDGTLFQTSERNKVEFQQNAVKHTTGSRIASIYETLSPVDKVSVSDFVKALEVKTKIQREIERLTSMNDVPAQNQEAEKKHDWHSLRCSFCGKTSDEVKKMIAGPNGVYICDECIGICDEILKEDTSPQEG